MLIMPKLLKHRGRISSALGTLSQTWSLAFDKSHPSDTADLHPREMRDSEHSKLTSAIARQPVGPEVLLVQFLHKTEALEWASLLQYVSFSQMVMR